MRISTNVIKYVCTTAIFSMWAALSLAGTVYVDASNAGFEDGSLANPWNTIQEGVDNAIDGDTIMIAAGIYPDPVNIDTRNNLSLVGADRTTTILEPTTLVDWNALGHTTNRKCAIRIISSVNIDIQNLTIDMNIVAANNVFAILYGNSSGDMDNIHILNVSVPDSLGGYAEIGIFVRAIDAPWTDGNRAVVTLRNSILENCGRIGVVTYDWVHMIIEHCEIFKDESDFGYGMELSSRSSAEVRYNAIHGFYTRAAGDGSKPAGIYIVNAFTNPTSPGTTKTVTIEFNDIYENANGLIIGNQFNNLAGDVDIVVNLTHNYIHDAKIDPAGWPTGNVTYGIILTDEDKSNGSSVTLNADKNVFVNNGDYGILEYGNGDADVTVNLTNNLFSGHTNIAFFSREDGAPAGSSHSVTMSGNSFYNNGVDIYNDPVNSTGSDINSDGDYIAGTTVGSVIITNPLAEDPFEPELTALVASDQDGINNADPTAYTNSATIDLDFTQIGFIHRIQLIYSEQSDFSTTASLDLFSGQTTATLTLTAGDGTRSIYIKPAFYTSIGPVVNDSIILDTQIPASQVTGPTGTLQQMDPNVDIEFSISDAGPSGLQYVRLYYRFDSGAWTQYPGTHATSPITFDTSTTGGSGTYEFYTVAMDNAGNEEVDPGAPDAAPLVFSDTSAVGDWMVME